ncbi:unnamed protein product [Caenorhabditis bovis]|uniref:Box C/D snoRNA protein 1 n=1 Tax=Caenorhabditis bovis TaxID=2654633 RepID=A0A8S1EC87_9PELO|nr:unnamed protein product [Caenorhabditis bovis]
MTEILNNPTIEEHEDGEITDDEDDRVQSPTVSKEEDIFNENEESDDESPDEILNSYAKKAEEIRLQQQNEPAIDPKLCHICRKNEHKYRCPRCDLRSCSLECSKRHKIERDCDGVRQPFTKVEKLSEYDPQKSIDDQKFMHTVKEKIGLDADKANQSQNIEGSSSNIDQDPNALRQNANSGIERYLLNAARFRHIWLGFSNNCNNNNESRHEQFSDTIFWTLTLIFRKQTVDGLTVDYEKRICSIPETIRLITVLKQFFKPRKVGCIVSESELDLEKLAPFIERGMERINVFLEVHGIENKYYGVIPDQTILQNTRNRVIADHPKFVITLDDEFTDIELISAEESEKLSSKFGGIANGNDRFNGNRRGGRGEFRRGGGRGGHGRQNFGLKRPNNGGHGDQPWKRTRGGGNGGFQHLMDQPSTSNGKISKDIDDEYLQSEANKFLNDDSEVIGADPSLCDAMNRFMRNEIDYDEFMRITGGKTLEEEIENNDESIEDEAEEDVYEEVEEVFNEEEVEDQNDYTVQPENDEKQKEVKERILCLPEEARSLMGEVIIREEEAPMTIAEVLASQISCPEPTPPIEPVPKLNSLAYGLLSTIMENTGDLQKSVQFGLLEAHLNSKTGPEEWIHLGDKCGELNMLEEAASCYDKAIRLNQENWEFYDKRIRALDKLDMRSMAMKVRLQAVQHINVEISKVSFEWFQEMIRIIAHYYITINDEEKTAMALEAYILRSREYHKDSRQQQETLTTTLLKKNKFTHAAQVIVALNGGIKMTSRETGECPFQILYNNGTYSVFPFPPNDPVEIQIDEQLFFITLHVNLIISFLHMEKENISVDLWNLLLERDLSDDSIENCILDIPRASKALGNFNQTLKFLDDLYRSNFPLEESAEYFYLKGTALMALKKDNEAMEALEKVISIKPDHVDSRINLSSLQQKHGMCEEALMTLDNFDLDLSSQLPDERLLERRCEILFQSGKHEQFIKDAKMLLVPNFYEIYTNNIGKKRRATKDGGPPLSTTLRSTALAAVCNTSWERLVKKNGQIISQNNSYHFLSPVDLHDYCLKLMEAYIARGKYNDALIVCCYAFLHSQMAKEDRAKTFRFALFFCAIKAKNYALAFEFTRWFYSHVTNNESSNQMEPIVRDIMYKRIFNAMNFVFANSQNISYHRFIMRALVKSKDNHALQAISGNNSLITGTYRHALGEYLRVWVSNRKNPLICLLLALTFIHMSCKKDLSGRHIVCLKGFAFMKKYQNARSVSHEVNYNLARMFHQLSMLPLAMHFYKKVLQDQPPHVYEYDDEGNEICVPSERYDLRRLAAHNLALIYRSSGNDYAVRELYEKYLMFVLSLLHDTVAIKPHELGKSQTTIIKKRLNQRLANMVVPDLGLCICVYDITEIGDSYILPGEGNCRVRVTFRMIVFRPFKDEVIEGKVIGSSKLGLTLSLEFFEDIFVPAEKLPEPHVFEEDGQVWYWEYPTEDGEPPAKLYMDPGKVVRFKTIDVIFKDLKPDLTAEELKNEKSMEVIGTMAGTGLGCVGWWAAEEEEEEAEDEEMEETQERVKAASIKQEIE